MKKKTFTFLRVYRMLEVANVPNDFYHSINNCIVSVTDNLNTKILVLVMLFMIYLLETTFLLNRYEVRDVSSADFYSRPGNFPMIYFTSTWHVVKIVRSHGNLVRSPRRQCSTTY